MLPVQQKRCFRHTAKPWRDLALPPKALKTMKPCMNCWPIWAGRANHLIFTNGDILISKHAMALCLLKWLLPHSNYCAPVITAFHPIHALFGKPYCPICAEKEP